ncbi:MAG TPA: GntR family transcriptional regulator [Anaerolineales bacterium]|nr:GntR family transcriptional regulator [Anaerolineales bacterium]
MDKVTEFQPTIVRPKRRTLTDATVSAIGDAIRSNRFPQGSQLPSELELMQILGVSRTTLREALRTLEEQGRITRRRGLGTFVSERSIVKDLSINFGITEMIRQAGFTPKTIQCDVHREPASARVAEHLQLAEGDPIYVVRRLRLANDTPIVWSDERLPASILDGRSPNESELKDQSLYDYLEKHHGIRIYQGTAVLLPIAAPKDVAEKLQVPRHSTLLLISQTDSDEARHPIIFSEEYHLTDKITFVIQRKGPHY